MKIYNTLTKKKEEFVPLEEGKVKMYVCGPTVYNLIHIGNARPMIIFDTFRRYLEYKGYDVNYVSNFTDVDDKIIKKAIEEGTTAEEISQRYIKECKKDMHDLNIEPATTHPLATQEIDGMIEMIKTLIDKGYAYDADGTVYYRTRKFKDYGKLSKKNIDDLEAGHRDIKVAGEESKEDPLDFVLWKPKKEGEPSWPSPWSDGRPGWHIECSVMSKKYLGDEIDIHAGGEDLIFPHHENEIAQSEAANGCEFSKYWMHNGFLNINNKKMSKSLGNFFTVRDISEKYDLQVLRFFMLSAHYRSPLNFSDDLMESAKNGLERIITSGAKIRDIISNGKDGKVTDAEAKLLDEAKEYITKFEEAMDDDCNTANAISAVFELVKFANSNLNEGSTKEFATGVYEILDKLCNVLGIILEKEEEKVGDEDYIEEMIAKRAQAKKDRDFAMADQIRDELAAKGIVLKDTREGTKWSRA
ncbi:cysteine--tRNA ligase [uncultured Eubacterium sp.]|uniref:cysteine--tRNA ligase n=1 Tax=uncultured Eubacterium sp. TaxID=165185 RepID=UPI002594FDFC|nr:cysteine--tRNA ligase [uncultured Eubacterium sp.]